MGVSQVGKINDEMRIQPYPFPIQVGGSLMSEASSASRSSRSSLRRMRCETFTFTNESEQPRIEAIDRWIKLFDDFDLVSEERRYQDRIQLIEEFEADWNDHMCEELIREFEKEELPGVDLRVLVIHFVGSHIDIEKACLQALEKNDQALINLEEGFRKFSMGLDQFLNMIEIMEGFEFTPLEREEVGQCVLAAHLVCRGLIQFSLGAESEAAKDLRAFYLEYAQSSMGKTEDITTEFFLRVMEDLTGEKILPTNFPLDEKNIVSLFLHERYEEALERVESEEEMKMCLAMLGRYEEALAIDTPFETETIKALIEFKRGNIAKAKELILLDHFILPHSVLP